jgi:Mitochondrial resolvase Ydc2 / RNA splicing MRS1
MKIVSFDVGIVNLAYCVLKIVQGSLQIVEWRVVDITLEIDYSEGEGEGKGEGEGEGKGKAPLCQQRKKSTFETLCDKRAKYVDLNLRHYCLVHAKSSPWHLPFVLKSTTSAPSLTNK